MENPTTEYVEFATRTHTLAIDLMNRLAEYSLTLGSEPPKGLTPEEAVELDQIVLAVLSLSYTATTLHDMVCPAAHKTVTNDLDIGEPTVDLFNDARKDLDQE